MERLGRGLGLSKTKYPMLKVTPVTKAAQRKTFIRFPWKIYKDDPHWVPPLLMDMNQMFSPKKKHPFYEYGDMTLFTATKDDQVVGRIAAITNDLYDKVHGGKNGFFGFFECIHDQVVANALFEKAEAHLRSKNCTQVFGPANPSANYEFALLIDGFNDAPRIMMTYNPPWYRDLIEAGGFKLVKKLLAYELDSRTAINEKMERVNALVRERYGVTTRTIKLNKMKSEIEIIRHIYEQAWEANWGHLPLTYRELKDMGDKFRLIADKNIIVIAEANGEPVGMGVSLPDYNRLFKSFNGKLFPFNFIKLLRGKRKIGNCRVLLLGVVPEYRRKGIDGLVTYEMIKRAQVVGYHHTEAGWILEDNLMMNRAMENFKGSVYKTYGVFSKTL